MKPNPHRCNLSIYPHRIEIAARFSDIDPQWHLNNVRLAEYYQEGRVSFHRSLKHEFDLERVHGTRTLVAHQSIDYLGEVRYPGSVTLGVGIAHVGTSSYSLGLAMFQQDNCIGLSMAVMVHADQRGPTPLPLHLRQILSNRLLPIDARSA
jgi:acyl-CoA thioester hydrolase